MTPQAQNVTFVGIGAIGLPMALSVAAAGFDVTGVDFSERQRVAALEQGLPAAADAASAVRSDLGEEWAETRWKAERLLGSVRD